MDADGLVSRFSIGGFLLIFAVGCGSSDASSTPESGPADAASTSLAATGQTTAANLTSSAPFFSVTLSGPEFATPQTFDVAPDRINLNLATAGGFVMRYQDSSDPIPSEQGGFYLRMFIGGIGPGTLLQPMSYEHGPREQNEDGWGIIVWPAVCLSGAGCPRIRMRTVSGTLDVTRYDQGEAVSRPHAEGPTAIAATAELIAHGQGDQTGQTYQVGLAFHLIDT